MVFPPGSGTHHGAMPSDRSSRLRDPTAPPQRHGRRSLPNGEPIRGSGLERSYFILAGHGPADLPLRVTEIGESWWPAGEICQRACSPIMAVELVIRGTIRLDQDGSQLAVGAGEAFLLKLGSRHQYQAVSGPVRKAYVGLAGPLAEETIARLPARVAWRDAPQALAIFRQLRRLFAHPGPDQHARASGLAYQLLVAALLSSRCERGEPELPAAVERVLPLIERHDGRSRTVGELARHAGVSAAHLHRLFRASMRTTPQRYGLLFAMRRAQAQLLNSHQSCREIAAGLGFAPLYFSAVFRRVVGIAPSEFRRRNR
jgi:AraC-like DNA-binding protein